MGASTFSDTVAKGKGTRTAQEAFEALRREAQYQSGHGGYTGTIAEKFAFHMIDPHQFTGRGSASRSDDFDGRTFNVKRPRKIGHALPTMDEAHAVGSFLEQMDDPSIADKWGPAGCIAFRAKGGRTVAGWVFFGWASC